MPMKRWLRYAGYVGLEACLAACFCSAGAAGAESPPQRDLEPIIARLKATNSSVRLMAAAIFATAAAADTNKISFELIAVPGVELASRDMAVDTTTTPVAKKVRSSRATTRPTTRAAVRHRKVLVRIDARFLREGPGWSSAKMDKALSQIGAGPFRKGSSTVVLSGEQTDALLKSIGGVKSMMTLNIPRVMLAGNRRIRVGGIVDARTVVLPRADAPGTKVTVKRPHGITLAAAGALADDRQSLMLVIEPHLTRLAGKPGALTLEEARAQGKAVVPVGGSVLMRLAVTRYELTGVRRTKDPKTGKPLTEIVKVPLHRPLEGHLFVLVKPMVVPPDAPPAPARKARGDGLVAHWSADGDAKANVGGNHGRVVGKVDYTADRHGAARSAFYFDGKTGRVVIPDADQLDTDDTFTLSAWVMRAYDGTTSRQIISKWQDTRREGDYGLSMTNAGQLCIMVGNSVGRPQQDHIYGKALAPREKWTHVAATFDRGRMKLYVNGRFDAEKMSATIKHTDRSR